MDLIYDVYLILRLHRREVDVFPELADIIDPPVRGAVDLDHIKGRGAADFAAVTALAARPGRRAALAVKSLGQNPRHSGLAHAAGPRKQIGMGYPPLLDAVFQGLRHIVLVNYFVKR